MKASEKERIIRERDSVAMAKNPDIWPCWPFLPLKHRTLKSDGNFPLLGVLFGDDQPIVYLMSLYEGISESPEKKVYESVEAIFADGWEVD